MIEVKEVTSNKDLKKFVKFPYRLYKDSDHYVPALMYDELNTLNKKKNPAFDYCESVYFIAYKDHVIAGRIAGIINKKYIEIWKNKYARFGWFDFIDDEEVSKALLGAVEKWALSKGMTGVHGPLGFCDLDREGMLIEGFDETSMIITNYNYPYYPNHMQKNGYFKAVDWLEYKVEVPDKIPDVLLKSSEKIISRYGLKVIRFKKAKDILKYAQDIFGLINECYKPLYGVVPLTQKQINSYIKQYFGFVNPDYVTVILDRQNATVAFGLAMPSLSAAVRKAHARLFPFGFIRILKAIKRNNTIDLYLIAVRPDYQNKGLISILMDDATKACIKNKIKFAETGPELEYNLKIQALWKYFSSKQHKKRRCYLKIL